MMSVYTAVLGCMAEDLVDKGSRRNTGGIGNVAEIDESNFGKRKYSRGRRVAGKWVLGSYCKTRNERFLLEWPNIEHDHNTLIPLIKGTLFQGQQTLREVGVRVQNEKYTYTKFTGLWWIIPFNSCKFLLYLIKEMLLWSEEVVYFICQTQTFCVV